MRLALLLIASLALAGTVAGRRNDGQDDGCGRVFPNKRPLTVPKSHFNKYLGLAFEFATRMSMLRRKMYHLRRIEYIKWQSKSKLVMRITNVFSSCRKVPWSPYYFAQCKPNYRKGTAACWATIDLLPRSLNIKRIYGPTCREFPRKTQRWPKRPNRRD